ncbi:L-2-hydroxyglutarate dehydrogenase, mitochondrial-like [Leptinotarsa decemlineata]|uniref:L-2-hydroxyglutarate dehydrogenase, mitochondrial-like n=1 Tax=Leptinotarsa decemlineata TaxID=7539 RepID=UPI003D307DB0
MFQNFAKSKTSTQLFRSLSLHLVQSNIIKSLEEGICYDLAVLGGGIIGTAISREIKKKSLDTKTILIEKESDLGKHQSSHNSGVIHSGVYYKPGSLKAEFCVKGRNLLFDYCEKKKVPYKSSGELIIGNNYRDGEIIEVLFNRGLENGVTDLKILDTIEQIKDIEPQCKGCQALWCPNTGNVDFKILTDSLGNDFRECGGDILFNNQVKSIQASSDCEYPIVLKCNENLYLKTKYLIICGGLQSGPILDLIDSEPTETRVFISFRVTYQLLKNSTISRNIFAAPVLDLPFLGVHLSPLINGDILLGPTAVPAYNIEGYKADELNLTYLKNTLTSDNFKNMTKRHFTKCVDQITRQMLPGIQIKELQKLASVSVDEIVPGPTAVQVQLVNKDGTFEEDFVFEFFKGEGIQRRIINCIFTPNPAATSSLAIAEHVAEQFFGAYSH